MNNEQAPQRTLGKRGGENRFGGSRGVRFERETAPGVRECALARLATERPTVRRLPKKALVSLMEFVELLTFRNEHEAKLASFRLRAAGIPSLVAKDDAGGVEP